MTYAPVTIASRCVGCGLCIVTCPEGALRPARVRPDLDGLRCTGCLACLEVCPVDAIDPGETSSTALRGRS